MTKSINVINGIALFLLLSGSLALPVSAGLPAGTTAPDFNLPTITGAKLSLSQFRGQVVILQFWKSD